MKNLFDSFFEFLIAENFRVVEFCENAFQLGHVVIEINRWKFTLNDKHSLTDIGYGGKRKVINKS